MTLIQLVSMTTLINRNSLFPSVWIWSMRVRSFETASPGTRMVRWQIWMKFTVVKVLCKGSTSIYHHVYWWASYAYQYCCLFCREPHHSWAVCRDSVWWFRSESHQLHTSHISGHSTTDWGIPSGKLVGGAKGPEGHFEGLSNKACSLCEKLYHIWGFS